jgi:hypothetical protein
MPETQQPPFPIVLDLTDNDAYSVLTTALGEYAETARGRAADEAEIQVPNQHQIDFFNKLADIAESLVDDVERQLEELGKALS